MKNVRANPTATLTTKTGAATYHDVVRVVCRPIPNRKYHPAIAVQADGEVLGASCAAIEMAGLNICLLSSASQ